MSRSLWLVALLVVVASVPDATSPARAAETAATTIAAGDAALAKFDLTTAVAAYRDAHRLAPDNSEAAWKLARALCDQATLTKDRVEQKRLCAGAESPAREAVRLSPNDSKGHTYLAIAVGKLALYDGGKRKVELSNEVKSEAEKSIALNSKEDLAYHVLGIWNREMAQLNWMLRTFAELLYGKLPSASLADAISDLRRAAELAPDVVPHHVELGITLKAARQYPEAKEQFDKALSLPKSWVTDDYYKELAKANYRK